MIDLHNHILPAVDDGAAGLDESLEIARQFLAEGVTQIAATPHLDPERGNGVTAEEMRAKVSALQEALQQHNLPLTVLPGQELYLTPEAPALLEAGTASPLGAGRAVLVEVSFDRRPAYLEDTLFHLQLAGYQPILAHPERYTFVQQKPERVDALVARGVLLQLTAPSLLGEYGTRVQRTAEGLLQRGAYALAASDRHHPGPARSLAALHERIAELVEHDLADLLLRDNPARVLKSEPAVQPELQPAAQRSFFARWTREG